MKIKYGVIGSGAIGGFYGSKLAHAGKEVHFLFHSDYHFVCENGLQVDSCDGSFHLDGVNAYQHTIDMPKCDVILVGLKSINNGLLLEMLPPLLHPKSLVILIQNGIGLAGVSATPDRGWPGFHLFVENCSRQGLPPVLWQYQCGQFLC